MRRRVATRMAVLVAAGLLAGASPTSAQDQAQPTGLPDLVMHKITNVKTYQWLTDKGRKVKHRWAVRFSSTIDNLGPGHFLVHAHRAHVGQPCPPGPGVSGVHRCEKGNM